MRLILLLLLFAGSVLPAHASNDAFTDADYGLRQEAFQKVLDGVRRSDDEFGKQKAMESAYRDFMRGPQPDIVNASPAALRTAAKAADTIAFYTANPSHVLAYSNFVAELGRRGVAEVKEQQRVFEAMLHARMFDDARRWAKENPAIKANVPEIAMLDGGQRGRTELLLSGDGKSLRQVPIAFGKGIQVIAVGYPLCRYSARAADAIGKDGRMWALLDPYIKWLAPQSRHFDLEVLHGWNTKNPHAKLTMVYKESEWPEIPGWGTPNFYFFKDGKLLARVEGWPQEGRKDEMIAALAKVGLTY